MAQPQAYLITAVVGTVALVAWPTVIRRAWVRRAAENYTNRLFEAADLVAR